MHVTVEELLQNDIIQESNSDFASPILMVKKKTGEQRLCVDFRALNNKTKKDCFPLPLIEDQLNNLSGNRYFTSLDLSSGYYHIPMAQKSRQYTGFVTPDGHYEFKRMPFGLANAPAVFQRLINQMLGSKRFDTALAYLDDILVPSASIQQGFQRLEEVLKLLREYGLTLKLSKCRFFDNNINYLGYEISFDGIRLDEHKILAVKEFSIPSNVHEVDLQCPCHGGVPKGHSCLSSVGACCKSKLGPPPRDHANHIHGYCGTYYSVRRQRMGTGRGKVRGTKVI